MPIIEPDGRVHIATLTADSTSDLDFRAFQGPSCLEPAKNVSLPRLEGHDLVIDWTITKGKPDSICVRTRQNNYTVWTSSLTSVNATCW
jgi:hypothetical protein